MLRGSYHNGFAPRDGMPLYPSLWRGCIGAWAPCLGPTGLTLRDWCGYANHGALTNMTADADWLLVAGVRCNQFGSTKMIPVSSSDVASLSLVNKKAWTIFAWIYPTTIAPSGFPVIYSYGRWRASMGMSSDGKVDHWRNNTTQYKSTTALTASKWQAVAVSNSQADAITFWLNGATNGTASGLAAVSTGAGSSIGNVLAGDGPFAGYIADVRLYERELSAWEHAILALKPGIAYDLAQFRMLYSEQVAGFQAAWALRQRLILGGGGGLG